MNITEKDVRKIEQELNILVEADLPILRTAMSHADAADEMLHLKH